MMLPLEVVAPIGTILVAAIGALFAENRRLNNKIVDQSRELLAEVKTERDEKITILQTSNALLAASNQGLTALTAVVIRPSKAPTGNA